MSSWDRSAHREPAQPGVVLPPSAGRLPQDQAGEPIPLGDEGERSGRSEAITIVQEGKSDDGLVVAARGADEAVSSGSPCRDDPPPVTGACQWRRDRDAATHASSSRFARSARRRSRSVAGRRDCHGTNGWRSPYARPPPGITLKHQLVNASDPGVPGVDRRSNRRHQGGAPCPDPEQRPRAA